MRKVYLIRATIPPMKELGSVVEYHVYRWGAEMAAQALSIRAQFSGSVLSIEEIEVKEP